MTALSQDRNTPERDNKCFRHPVAASAKVYAGALVMLDAAGNAAGATTATGLIPAGRADEQADNSGGVAGAVEVTVRRGTFRFANDGSIDRTHIGGSAYAVDDQTVAATDAAGTRSACGTIRDVDAAGVWIEI